MSISDIINQEWDYIVVGTGMGGATTGYALAKAGHRVLFLEKGEDHATNPKAIKGDFLERAEPSADHGGETAYRNAGRSSVSIWDSVNNHYVKPLLGSGTGGSSALYGMVMERFWPQDFKQWPIDFTQMEPFYRQAESLFRVNCSISDPLRSDQTFNYIPGPKLKSKTERFTRFLQRKGLHPYYLPLALDWTEGCHFCQSFLCDKHCKNDAAKICLEPAQKDHGAVLLSGCEVIRLESDQQRITRIVAQYQGQTVAFTAKRVILALGAIMTPLLLLRSSSDLWPQGLGNTSGMVGRNLMRHYIDLLVIFSRSPYSKEDTLKELSINDFYVVNGEKFGNLGSFGHMPPTAMLIEDIEADLIQKRSSFLPIFQATKKITSAFLSRLFSQAGSFALILEDLPYEDNAVSWRKDSNYSQIEIQYTIRPSEWERIRRFRKMAMRSLWPNPLMLIPQADNLKFLAHVSGTCRFGDDPKTSVLNKFNRSHDVENLYIVDASFFPSSGGTNPGLTIAANALRVAEHLLAPNSV